MHSAVWEGAAQGVIRASAVGSGQDARQGCRNAGVEEVLADRRAVPCSQRMVNGG